MKISSSARPRRPASAVARHLCNWMQKSDLPQGAPAAKYCILFWISQSCNVSAGRADETSMWNSPREVSWDKAREGRMTRLRQLALLGLAAVAIGATASSAFAAETGSFQNRLAGATIGLPAGAAPPPGLYASLSTFYLDVIPPVVPATELGVSVPSMGSV